MIFGTKYSGNEFWMDILYHDHVHGSDIIPLVGPTFLWDARLTNTVVTDGDSVVSWFDYYANTELNQNFGPDLAKAPTYQTFEDIATIHFNGVNNYLGVYPLNEITDNFTIFIVVSNLQTNLAENAGSIMHSFLNGNGDLDINYLNPNINTFVDLVDSGVYAAQSKQIIAMQISGDGTLMKTYQNGGTPTSLVISTDGGPGFLQIGSKIGDNYLDGDISWIAYYNTALSDNDMNTAFTYAGNAFGITVTPVS